MNPLAQLILTALVNQTPNIIAAFKTQNPDAPTPTSDEVIAAWESLYASSVAKDELIKALNRPNV